VLLEVCVDSPDGIAAAIKGGADRVEICSALALGGLTPTTTMMIEAVADDFPCVAMIRPRAGDFVWTPTEVAHMQGEIDEALEMGVGGLALGASRPDGTLDAKVLKALVKDMPEDVELVLHRCIDLTPDPLAALETAIALGFDRVLTSGGALRAVEGLGRLRALFDRAAGRIEIMPGSGITPDTISQLAALLPLTSVHASCAKARPQDPRAVALGLAQAERRETDLAQVRAMRAALDALGQALS
jgi:copper homeostasis protein